MRHPQHLLDVLNALVFLDAKFNISNRYILVGHSAGATLAFQLGRSDTPPEARIPQPTCILGVAGIYNLKSFIQAHSDMPVYSELVCNAFPERSSWVNASPSLDPSPKLALWQGAEALVICYSKEDGAVEDEQATFMMERLLSRQGLRGKVHYLLAHGEHDEIWQNGHNLAGLITRSLELTRFRGVVLSSACSEVVPTDKLH